MLAGMAQPVGVAERDAVVCAASAAAARAADASTTYARDIEELQLSTSYTNASLLDGCGDEWAVAARSEAAAMDAMAGQAAALEGQVVWRRRFNAVFHFFDLRTAGHESAIRILVSSGHMPKDLAKEAGKTVRCGDVVRVTGQLDADKQLWRVSALELLSRWSDANLTAPFTPQPRSIAGPAVPPAEHAPPRSPSPATLAPPSPATLTRRVCKFFVNTGRCATPGCHGMT